MRRLVRAGTAIVAAALDLLLAADYRVRDADVRLLLPINDGHFWPGVALCGLLQQVGFARARQIVMWGKDITADHAAAIELVDRISDDLDDATEEATILFGRISHTELAIRRQPLSEAVTSTFDDALGAHLSACDREPRRLANQTVIAPTGPR